jgi:hypothetical protein
LTKIERLQERVEKLGGGDGWVPGWLTAVGSREELAEWRSINRAYRGLDRCDRIDQFIRAIRLKHPNMPLTIEEQIQEEVRKLTEGDLVGLTEEDMQD